MTKKKLHMSIDLTKLIKEYCQQMYVGAPLSITDNAV